MKILKIFGVVLLVLLIAVVVGVSFFLGNIIKTGVETVGPEITGVEVRLDSSYVQVLRGKAQLKGLFVGNPEGFKTKSAIELGKIEVKIDLASLMTDTIRITRIFIQDPTFTMEGSLTGSNIKKLIKQIEGEDEDSADEDETVEVVEKTGKKVIIDDIIIDGAKVKLSMKLLQGLALSLPIPEIHLEDLGKEEEASLTDVLKTILFSIDDAIIAVVKGSGKLIGKAGELTLDAAGAAGGLAVDAVGGTAKLTGSAVVGVGKGTGKLLLGAANLVTGGGDDESDEKDFAEEPEGASKSGKAVNADDTEKDQKDKKAAKDVSEKDEASSDEVE